MPAHLFVSFYCYSDGLGSLGPGNFCLGSPDWPPVPRICVRRRSAGCEGTRLALLRLSCEIRRLVPDNEPLSGGPRFRRSR